MSTTIGCMCAVPSRTASGPCRDTAEGAPWRDVLHCARDEGREPLLRRPAYVYGALGGAVVAAAPGVPAAAGPMLRASSFSARVQKSILFFGKAQPWPSS